MGHSHSQYFSSCNHNNPSFPSVDSTLDPVLWKRIEETATLARQAILGHDKKLEDVQNILEGFSHVSEVINIRDMSGFSLLQHAIIANTYAVVKYLLQKGADVNIPSCARPLHLAAKLGRVRLVHLLLEYHADPDVMSSVCYPDVHFASEIVCQPQWDHMHLACNGDIYDPKSEAKSSFEFPRYYAILADNVEIVKIFDKATHATHEGNTLPDLHLACKLGSKECVSYFLQQNKDAVNQLDFWGFSPVMHTLKWSKGLVELLVLNGALLTLKTKSKETLLHLLLREHSSNMVDVLKYLLDCGLRMNVNQVDSSGNSALNTLLLALEKHQYCIKHFKDISGNALAARSKFSRTVLSNSSPTLSLSHVDTGCEHFTDTETQYIKCVNLLLDAGLNPNIANRLGNTSLHIITRLHDQATMAEAAGELTETYIDMRFIFTVVRAILKSRGNVNILNNSDCSIVTQFIFHSISEIAANANDPYMLSVLEHQVEYFIATVRLLRRFGGDLNNHMARSAHRVCYLHVLFDVLDEFHSASHLLNADSPHNEQVRAWASKILRLIMNITRCFLECGLDPNSCIDSVLQRHFSLLYYKLLTSRPIVSMQEIESFLQLLLHFGIDADRSGQHILMTVLRPHTSSGYRQLPCYPLLHVINLIGTRSHEPQHESELLSLIEFLYNCLAEGLARQCVRLYLESDKYDRSMSNYAEFHTYLSSMISTPRKLKQTVAKFIYQDIARRQMSKVRRLPLPVLLQNYVGSFQY